MNQFIWIITAPVLFDSKYCDIACYWGNYPIQLLVTEWFVSTFPSYIAIVYSLSRVLYIQQYNIAVDIFLCHLRRHVILQYTCSCCLLKLSISSASLFCQMELFICSLTVELPRGSHRFRYSCRDRTGGSNWGGRKT